MSLPGGRRGCRSRPSTVSPATGNGFRSRRSRWRPRAGCASTGPNHAGRPRWRWCSQTWSRTGKRQPVWCGRRRVGGAHSVTPNAHAAQSTAWWPGSATLDASPIELVPTAPGRRRRGSGAGTPWCHARLSTATTGSQARASAVRRQHRCTSTLAPLRASGLVRPAKIAPTVTKAIDAAAKARHAQKLAELGVPWPCVGLSVERVDPTWRPLWVALLESRSVQRLVAVDGVTGAADPRPSAVLTSAMSHVRDALR